jgi:hypothetical protein
MNIYEQIVVTMREYLLGTLNPQQFVERYGQLWRAIRDQQIASIEGQEEIGTALQELKAQILAGVISPDEYQLASSELFARVEGVSVAPGSAPDEILSHLFVEANAYEEDPEFRESYQIDEDALRSAVFEAFESLSSIEADTGTPNDKRYEGGE